ncbi:MAG: DNA integrity scanning protein DisA nucleotide-binding domain protein [Candidatus Pacearchaeota archaeon]|nr:DNA integrity scanning protein DisA nucleotide-binding domain protein [Candidatus Pacearchaeota archaeon]
MVNKRSTKNKKLKEIEEKILKLAIGIAKKGEGALFVIVKGKKPEYSLLVKQTIKPFNVLTSGTEKTLQAIATIDGAVIIDKEGFVLNYGAMIKKTKPFVGFGTRHAAAITASKEGNIVILCSEEEHKVKIFRNGKFIMQIDALQKDIEKNVSKIANILESIGAGFVGTIGAIAIAPTMGIALIPGVLIFGGSYYALKTILKRLKEKKFRR